MSSIGTPRPGTPLRLWPGVTLAVIVALARYVLPFVAGDSELVPFPLALAGVIAGIAGAIGIALWWIFFSRAPWPERLGVFPLMIAALFVTSRVVHESIQGGMMGMMLFIYSIPILSLALVAWAVAARHRASRLRYVTLVAVVLLACAPWTLVRTAGIIGPGSEFHWRWTDTPEERLLASGDDVPAPPAMRVEIAKEPATSETSKPPAGSGGDASPGLAPVIETAARVTMEPPPAPWPGFRGPARDSVVRGTQIDTDWSRTPPTELWRRAIGPGWSSFSVRGELLYTQEQRGDDEIVGAYRISTGEPVWRHRDAVRFWESNGGAGPRATPTLDRGRVYAFGATGVLNALDADTGAVVWSRNVASDTGRAVPDWGFSSSPIVAGDVVVVAAAGTLAGYEAATGHLRWRGPSYGGSYSSPHRATIDGVEQVLLLGGPGAIAVAPATGAVLWEHEWAPGAIVQPAVLENGDILINTVVATGGAGLRRLSISRASGGWRVEERWTSSGLKPYFNDFVVHEGHAFGFDGSILACIDLEDGKRMWKGGRFGNGQMLLLPDEDLLLVLSEDGELALVSATPDRFREVARAHALDGKTWNHPVLVGGVLLVRNGQEMAAFRLPPARP
jgi:outer membrane protein assembly factor BamB